jgi:hypothetical protein
MKKISTLDELKYRKLYLRSEIRHTEDNLKRQLVSLKEQVNSPLVKNEILQGIISNPSLIINAARISYDLVKRWKERRRRKKSN